MGAPDEFHPDAHPDAQLLSQRGMLTLAGVYKTYIETERCGTLGGY